MKIIFLIILILLHITSYGFSVINLGNLEVEGEVRRPMINLYNNVVEQKDRFELFAYELTLDVTNLENFKYFNNDELSHFEILENEFSEVK